MFEARRIAKVYADGRGLKPLTLTIKPGELVAIVGHNGAGKSTLLKMAAGWIRPSGGDLLIDGISVRRRREWVRKVGFVAETPNLFEAFSVESNLCLHAGLFGLPRQAVDDAIDAFGLATVRRAKVQTLSKGLRQRVSLARSLLPDPPYILLDEATSGLDFDATRELHRRVLAVHRGGKTVVFTSHRPEEIRTLATRIVLLHGGELAFDGEPGPYFASATHAHLYQT